jgi:hypothetical protein
MSVSSNLTVSQQNYNYQCTSDFENAGDFFSGHITLWPISRDILRGPKKNNLSNFQNQQYIGNFMPCGDQLPAILILLHLHIKLSPHSWNHPFNLLPLSHQAIKKFN